MPRGHRPKPQWFIFGEVAVQPTRYGTIIVDTDDLPEIEKHRWHVRAGGGRTRHLYVRAWVDSRRASADRGKTVYLHHMLMPPPAGQMVDFKNGNGLDCRRCNLRHGDKTQDSCNRRKTNSSSGFLGVDFDKQRGKWRVQIGYRGVHRFGGRFNDLETAVAAREEKAANLHGEFASTLNAELQSSDR
jgi:hypothetical protein